MSQAIESALVVIGVAGLAHLHAVDTVHMFVKNKTTGGTDKPKQQASGAQFGKWVGGYIALSAILLAGSGGQQYGRVFDALAILIATGAVILYMKDIGALFGIGI